MAAMLIEWPKPFERKEITLERVLEYRYKKPKRIDLIRTHPGRPKRRNVTGKPHIVGGIDFPFEETIRPIFEADTGIELIHKPEFGNYFHSIQDEDEFQRITEWVQEQKSKIFIRSTLNLCVALDCNHIDDSDSGYTQIGQLEHDAKKSGDEKSIDTLSEICAGVVASMPFYRDAPLVAAVPPMSGKKKFDLPTRIAESAANALGKKNLTGQFVCPNPKEKGLKEASIEEKWAILEKTGLHLKVKIPGNSDVVLIDDKYQSGTTMQFVAMKLQEAGARYIFGISLVKTLGDTDNAS